MGGAAISFMHNFELFHHSQQFQRTSLERHRSEELRLLDQNPSAQDRWPCNGSTILEARLNKGEGQGRFDHGSGGLPSSEAKQRAHNHHTTGVYGACLVTMQRNHARRVSHSPLGPPRSVG